MIDRRVSDLMAGTKDLHLTWCKAQMGRDLAEYNARMGGKWSYRVLSKKP